MSFYQIPEVGEELPLGGRILWQGEEQILELCFAEEEIREYELKMLQYCEIKSILKPRIQRQRDRVYLYFSITNMQMRREKGAVQEYLCQLQELREKLPEYLLEIDGVVIWQQYCFFFADRKEWCFLYLPLRQKSRVQDLDFFRGLFYEIPQLYLQMEMMKENTELTLADYLQAAKIAEKRNR